VPATKRAPLLFTVPAGTPSRICEKCPATIFMVRTEKSWMPIRCDVPDGIAPTADECGRGQTHWADCPAAAEFRKRVRR
jgi:hypothetical protein